MSTRQRSTRAKAPKTYAESDGEPEKESIMKVDTEEEAAFPSKASSSKKVAGRKRGAPSGGKPKTGKPAKRRRNQLQGKLEDFKKLPLELKFEIFELLHPRILMLISRTNHEYRELLLSTDTVWKQSRLRSGMPDLQAQDITERQYILLMFDKTCHGPVQMNWSNCARLCSSCRYDTKTTEAQLRKFLATLHPRAKECAKVTKPFDAGSYYVCDGGYRIPRGIKKLSDKLNKMNKQEVDDFVAKRLALKAAIAEDAKNICDWIDEEHSAKDGTKAENQEERARQIKERLLAMGWTEESLTMSFWYYNSRVQQPRKLTDTIWHRVEGPLLQDMYRHLIEERNRRRRFALHAHYSELLQSHSKSDLFPSRETFLSLPSVKALWLEKTNPLPESIDATGYAVFDAEKWSVALPSIQAAILQYQEEVEALAIARLTAGYEARGLPIPPPTEILDDPRSIFRYVPPDPPGDDWRDADLVFPFPAIHAKMRDRQDGFGLRRPCAACAAEFMSVKEVKVLGGYVGGNTLRAELKL
ncbi:hypothetical protein BDZ89DRAFT_1072048 [Hymenopellis radicata]|nr:hypothetical protein BDZ89DRAFT_1072048 [Hymenopellis radicata]